MNGGLSVPRSARRPAGPSAARALARAVRALWKKGCNKQDATPALPLETDVRSGVAAAAAGPPRGVMRVCSVDLG